MSLTGRQAHPDYTRILDRKVRYVGDAVALVAATSEEIAKEALRLIDVEYEVLPAVFDMEEALKPGAPQLYDELPGQCLNPGTLLFWVQRGSRKLSWAMWRKVLEKPT